MKTQTLPAIISPLERLIYRFDVVMIFGPLAMYATGATTAALWLANAIIPVMYAIGVRTGFQAYARWEGQFKSFRTQWNLAMSTGMCVFALGLLADWYATAGWHMVGLKTHLAWAAFNYCGARITTAFHLRVRECG